MILNSFRVIHKIWKARNKIWIYLVAELNEFAITLSWAKKYK